MAVHRKLPDADSMEAHADSAARFLRALANPHRLQVLCVLNDGEYAVGELNTRIPLSQSALSQHLKVLRDDGLVTTRRVSQTVYYRVAPGPALGIIEVLHRHFCEVAVDPVSADDSTNTTRIPS